MAVGTITNVAVDPHSSSQAIPLVGNARVTVSTVVGSGSYTTNGDSLTAAQLGLGTVLFAQVSISASSGSNCSAIGATYDVTNSKLKCFSAADSAGAPVSETGSTTNLSGLTFTVIAWGY